MRRTLFTVFALVLAGMTLAPAAMAKPVVQVFLYPPNPISYVNGHQMLTAKVTGAPNSAVTWSDNCSSPTITGVYNTYDVQSNTMKTCTVTATSVADKTKSAKSTITWVASPTNLVTAGVHPRLILTQALVDKMISNNWNQGTNPAWVQFQKTAANMVKEIDAKYCFSFSSCPAGFPIGQPRHWMSPTLYNPPAIKNIARDAAGVVTVTTASAFDVWAATQGTPGDPAASVTVAATDSNNFPNGVFRVSKVIDANHFQYVDAGAVVASPAGGTLSMHCGNSNPTLVCDAGDYRVGPVDAAEQYGMVFALMSKLTSGTTSAQYAIRSHDVIMWALSIADGKLAFPGGSNPSPITAVTCDPAGMGSHPFGGCGMVTGNRAHQADLETWAEAVDWNYASFSKADKATIRDVFRAWANYATYNVLTGYPCQTPLIPGTVGAGAIQPAKHACLRWMENNLGLAPMQGALAMALSLDPADDVPDDGVQGHWNTKITWNPTYVPPNGNSTAGLLTTNSLRAYYYLLQGGRQLMHWASLEDPGITSTVLGIPNTNLGENFGGGSPEGSSYGPNFGFIFQSAMLSHTAGTDDPTNAPWESFSSSPSWDLQIGYALNSISPTNHFVSNYEGYEYDISVFGDSDWQYGFQEQYYKTISMVGIRDEIAGNNPVELNAARWLTKYAFYGGCGNNPGGACGSDSTYFNRRLAATIAAGSLVSAAYEFLMIGDPTAVACDPNVPTCTNPSGDVDPRTVAGYPSEWYSDGWHKAYTRSSPTNAASWLATTCAWVSADHQHADCGQTEFWYKGNVIVGAHGNYGASNMLAGATDWKSAGMLIPNTHTGSDPSYPIYTTMADRGSGVPLESFGSPTVLYASGGDYVHQYMDSTVLRNYTRPGHSAANDVAYATRDSLYLKAENIVVLYDRGSQHSGGHIKSVAFNTVVDPNLSGNVATVAVGNVVGFITTVLPTTSNFSGSSCQYPSVQGGAASGPCNLGEPQTVKSGLTDYMYTVTDTSGPLTDYFLHVVEAKDTGNATPATLVKSTSGTAFDGVEIGGAVNVAAFFMQDPVQHGGAFTTTTFTLPATITTRYVSGLAANKNYSVTVLLGGGKYNITISSTCALNCVATDKSGTLTF